MNHYFYLYNILILYDNKYYYDFKFYLIFFSIDNGVSVFGNHVRIRTPYVILRSHYIPIDKLYIIDEPIR